MCSADDNTAAMPHSSSSSWREDSWGPLRRLSMMTVILCLLPLPSDTEWWSIANLHDPRVTSYATLGQAKLIKGHFYKRCHSTNSEILYWCFGKLDIVTCPCGECKCRWSKTCDKNRWFITTRVVLSYLCTYLCQYSVQGLMWLWTCVILPVLAVTAIHDRGLQAMTENVHQKSK